MTNIRIVAILALTVTLSGCSEFMNGDSDMLIGDKDCVDIGEMVWVGDNDPHGLDADGDGWGCEEYA